MKHEECALTSISAGENSSFERDLGAGSRKHMKVSASDFTIFVRCTHVSDGLSLQNPPNEANSGAAGIFLCQFGVLVLYAALGIKLIRKVRQFAAGVRRGTFIDSGYSREITRVAALLVLYPIIYIALTLPLSAGRMWSMAREGQHYSMIYAVFAGCMITSCGVADVLVYSLTRLRLLRATGMAPDEHRSLNSDGVALHSRTASRSKIST